MKYYILQNTVTPYRISLFNKLYEFGVNLEVDYAEEMEKGRSWKIDYSVFKIPYSIDKGKKITIKGMDFLWNPNIIAKYRRNKDAKLILGGGWDMLDVIYLCVLKRLGILKNEIIFWSEANYLTNGARKKNWLRDVIRAFVYRTGEGKVIIPGEMARKTFDVWNIKGKQFIIMPNVIDEEKFLSLDFSRRIYTPVTEMPKFVLSVRLVEEVKGIRNFFEAIGMENIMSSQFYIMGDGYDEEMYKDYISENGYGKNIHLMGFCDIDTILNTYLDCDAMILPSFSDSSPLALVEGICSYLPMLVSNRCGNHYETVVDGVNGYIFDPDNHTEIKQAFENLLSRRSEWKVMGEESRKLFEKNYKQDVILKKVASLLNSK